MTYAEAKALKARMEADSTIKYELVKGIDWIDASWYIKVDRENSTFPPSSRRNLRSVSDAVLRRRELELDLASHPQFDDGPDTGDHEQADQTQDKNP